MQVDWMIDPDLIRFVDAQGAVRRQIVEELTAGSKHTHWIWFVFPQLSGLGRSAMAERYAIRWCPCSRTCASSACAIRTERALHLSD
jgi:uncharacterized protein (DUF1810 family)